MDVDNNTETTLFTIFDNTIPLTVTYYINVASTTADTLAIDEVGNGVPYTVIDNANANANANGGVTLYRTTFLTPSGVLSIFGPVDVKVNYDNKKVGVAGVFATATTTYPRVRVWYNEQTFHLNLSFINPPVRFLLAGGFIFL